MTLKGPLKLTSGVSVPPPKKPSKTPMVANSYRINMSTILILGERETAPASYRREADRCA